MLPKTSAAVLASLTLAACVGGPKPDVSLPAAYEARGGGDLRAERLDRWWTAFGDPQLEALVERALVEAPDARSAAERLNEARATSIQALTAFLPQGNVSGSARSTESRQVEGPAIQIPGQSLNGRSDSYGANFNVSWELDLFGRFFATRKAYNGDVAASRFAYEGARASLAAAVADSYFQVRGAAIQLEDARATAAIQRSLYEVAVKRSERGLAGGADADRAAGELAQSEGQVAALEAELTAARRSLLVLVGRGAAPIAEAPAPAEVGTIPQAPATLPGELLVRRPDVREAEARLQSAIGRRAYNRLAFLPTLQLTPGLGYARQVQPSYEIATRSWSWGGAASVPVLDIPRLLAELKAQNARTRQAAIAYEKSVQTAYGEAENALVRLDADRRRVVLLKDGEARAARAFEASRTAYAAGLTDLQTTLGAEQSWRAARTQLTAAQVQGLRRAVQTYKALGGGWPADAGAKPAEEAR